MQSRGVHLQASKKGKLPHGRFQSVLGAPIRVHDMTGDDLGTAHVPTPVAIGGMVATPDGIYRIVDIVTSPPGSLIAALCKVRPERLHVVAGAEQTRRSAGL
jgi:hypothetical protein